MDNPSGDTQQIKKPKISIGVPVYNEEKYIASTLDSILQQKLSNCEIIIADNASEDKTRDIISFYVEKYFFIRYVRHKNNIGAVQNFNFLIKESRGDYFVMVGAHDLWSGDYIEKLSEALNRRPHAVLASGLVQWINEKGEEIETNSDHPAGFVDTSGMPLYARLHQCLYMNPAAIYGMFRLDSLKKTRLAIETINTDVILLTELSVTGEFIIVPEVTWFWRENRKVEAFEERIARYCSVLFYKTKRPALPFCRMIFVFLTLIFYVKVKITWKERVLLFSSYVINVILRFSSLMIYDLKKYAVFYKI